MEPSQIEPQQAQNRMPDQNARQAAKAKGLEAVAAWLASGQELVPYCKSTGQPVWALRRWRREHADHFGIQIKRRGEPVARPSMRPKASMIPVQLLAPAMSMGATLTIEVRVPGGRAIVLPIETDSATVTRLVCAVEAAS